MIESVFFRDLAILMAVAGLTAAVFSRLGWPKVLGYILAGVVMSKDTWGGSFLIDPDSTQVVGQLGVIFLMFGMGLSFSPREMRAVRTVVLPSAVFDAFVMIALGYVVGTRVLHWGVVPSFFLGVAICDSATTLLAKVIDEMGWGKRPFARYVLGTSVCEDIICVGAIAVATGFAKSGNMSAGAFFQSLGGLGLFFLSVLVFGFILVPRLLKSVGKRKDDEALVLTLLGCCFLISFFAYKYEFSLALGAFLVGIIGGSSDVRDRLEKLVDPLKSMFSAVFFISIGLLVNPRDLMTYFPQILLVSGVVIGGKLVNNLFMSLATGTTLKTAVQNSFSLAQIGEFAFMTAILYKGLGADSTPAFFPIAIGASLLTTLLNPLMIRLSEPVGNWLEGALSARVLSGLSTYQAWVQKLNAEKDSEFRRRASSDLTHLCVYAALLFAVFTLVLQLYRFDYSQFSAFFERHDRFFFFIVAHVFFAALLPLIHKSARSLGGYVANVIVGKQVAERLVPMRRLIKTVVMVACFLPFLFEWEMIVLTHLPSNGVALAVVALTLVAAVAGWRFFRRTGAKAIDCFNEALTAEERRQELEKTMTITVPDGAIHRLTLAADSPAVGGTVVSMNIRAKTGASIVSVERGGVLTRNIGPEWEFAPGDTLVVLGDAHQLAALKDLLGVTA